MGIACTWELPPRRTFRYFATIAVQRILFPTDFSDASQDAEKCACKLADELQAERHVLHVIDDVYLMAPQPAAMVYVPPNLLNSLKATAENAVQKVAAGEWSLGKSVVRVVRMGAPHVVMS